MARKKDIKAQNPDYVIDVIEILAQKDPSGTNKYLPFMVKQTKEWVEWLHRELETETFKQMFEVVEDFEDLCKRNLLEEKDIYAYESNADIVEAVKFAKEKVTRSEVKKKETLVLHEDERWLVIMPLTSRSSNLYGKSTKWCVAGDDQNFKKYFNEYTQNGTLIYLIDKSVKDKDCRENPLSKVAFHQYKDKREGLTVWDTRDNQLNISNMMKLGSLVGGEVMDMINDRLENGLTNREEADKKGIKQE